MSIGSYFVGTSSSTDNWVLGHIARLYNNNRHDLFMFSRLKVPASNHGRGDESRIFSVPGEDQEQIVQLVAAGCIQKR